MLRTHTKFGLASALVGCLFLFTANATAQDMMAQIIDPKVRYHDFGTVARAAATEHRFLIKNPFSTPMQLTGVRASCGCTTPTILDKVIQPGETGTLLAKFNTGTFTGEKKATLTLSIARPIATELQLNVRGYIRSDIVLDPGQIEFGQVPEGERKIVNLNLDYAGRSDWKIEKITSALPYIKVDFKEKSRSPGRIQYEIAVGLDRDAPSGFINNQLVVSTNDRRLTTLTLPLTADVQPAMQFSPQSFDLGRVKPGEPIKQRLVVRGRKPFRILDIASESADVRFDPIAESKPAHFLNITLSPNSESTGAVVKGEVIVKTDVNDRPLKLGLTYELERGSEDFASEGEVTASK